MAYGMEVIVDVHSCQRMDRASITKFCVKLCDILGMQREDLYFWDYEGQPDEYDAAPAHLKGTSAVQFLRTSNVTIHALDELGAIYLNIFSCAPFSAENVRTLVQQWTRGAIVSFTTIERV